MLVAKRIKLSPLEREHLVLLKHWRNHPDIRKRTFALWPSTDLSQEIWYDQSIKSGKEIFFVISFIEKCGSADDAPLIGYCGISNINWSKRHGEVSVIIGDSAYWGKQLGVEILSLLFEYAFSEMGLHKLSIYTYSDNKRAIGLFRKFASLEGQLVAHEFRDGRWKDVSVLGLTEETYFSQVRGKYSTSEVVREETDK